MNEIEILQPGLRQSEEITLAISDFRGRKPPHRPLGRFANQIERRDASPPCCKIFGIVAKAAADIENPQARNPMRLRRDPGLRQRMRRESRPGHARRMAPAPRPRLASADAAREPPRARAPDRLSPSRRPPRTTPAAKDLRAGRRPASRDRTNRVSFAPRRGARRSQAERG
jgi:hypothetical protein